MCNLAAVLAVNIILLGLQYAADGKNSRGVSLAACLSSLKTPPNDKYHFY